MRIKFISAYGTTPQNKKSHEEKKLIFEESLRTDFVVSSVADPGCLSRIPDPVFYPSRIPDLGSRIPDPKTATKERGEKNLIYLFMM